MASDPTVNNVLVPISAEHLSFNCLSVREIIVVSLRKANMLALNKSNSEVVHRKL